MNNIKKLLSMLYAIMFLLCLLILEGENNAVEARSSRRYRRSNPYSQLSNKMKRTIKRVSNKIKRELVTSGYKLQDAVMDAGVALKSKITGKKPKKVWVQGHYKRGNKNATKGHWQRVKRKKSRQATGTNTNSTIPEGFDPTPTPNSPENGIAGGSRFTPTDPVLPPTLSKNKKYSSRR